MAKAPAAPETPRLIELGADNFKRLKAVRIRPDGHVTQITGKNGAGKTSVLDIVAAAIGGKDMCPRRPIKDGADQGEVFVDLGTLRATRRFWVPTGDSGDVYHTDLIVEYHDGRRPRHPQHVLDELRGTDLAADPIEFTRLPPKEQFDVLKALVPGFDFAANARQRKAKFDERTVVGRERDRSQAAADAIPATDAEPVSLDELLTRKAEADQHNETVRTRQQRRDEAAQQLENLRDEIDSTAARLRTLTDQATALAAKIEGAEPLPALIDTAAIDAQIREAADQNEQAGLARQKREHAQTAAAKRDEYKALSDAIDAIDKAKADAIAGAKLPVEGLGFGDDMITLNGQPFEQASMAEQLRASAGLAMALKPQLRLLLIRDGSLLDDDSMKLLHDLAVEHDFIVLLERVQHGSERVGVLIEDGEVKQERRAKP